ncbi:MAG: hypothetical protein AB4290_07665 [Spirulina sp.]
MPLTRLVRYLKSSRDNWKEKALEKQKKLRAIEQKVRDVEKSREKWKNRAKEAEKEIKKLKKEREESQKKENNLPEERGEEQIKPKGHHYRVKTIQIVSSQRIETDASHNSFIYDYFDKRDH